MHKFITMGKAIYDAFSKQVHVYHILPSPLIFLAFSSMVPVPLKVKELQLISYWFRLDPSPLGNFPPLVLHLGSTTCHDFFLLPTWPSSSVLLPHPGLILILVPLGSYNFVPDPKIQNFLSELVIQPDDTQPQPSFTTPHYTSNRATSPHVRLQPISFRPG